VKEKRLDDHARGVLVRGGGGRLSFSFSFSFSFWLSLVSSITQLSHTQLRPVRLTILIHLFLQQKLIQVDILLKRSCFFKSFCIFHKYVYIALAYICICMCICILLWVVGEVGGWSRVPFPRI